MIALLILFNICHCFADFSGLNEPHMLQAKRIGEPVKPIFEHATVHAVLFLAVAMVYTDFNVAIFVSVFVIQLVSHFFIDLLKGKLTAWAPNMFEKDKPFFWLLFGIDQLLHQIIIIHIANLVCTHN